VVVELARHSRVAKLTAAMTSLFSLIAAQSFGLSHSLLSAAPRVNLALAALSADPAWLRLLGVFGSCLSWKLMQDHL